MRIRMYNAGFGDCFCLREKNRNLLVDFGTSNHRIGGRRRRDVFDIIISDLSTLPNKALLLSNFQQDQLSGLFYLMKHRGSSYEFEKIYLPDVFSAPDQSRTLALLLLADMEKDALLPSRQVSLYSMAEALLRNPQKIELLSRGSRFEKKYVALWPDPAVAAQETDAILQDLWPEFGGILEPLISYAEKIRQLIFGMTEKGEKEADGKAPERFRLTDLEEEFRDLRSREEFWKLLEAVGRAEASALDVSSGTGSRLRDLRQKLGIVFQNQEDSEWNILFTGDIRPEIMQKIADNYDSSLPLHEHYWAVKVPHHGTASHYFDFSPYTPENMLIPGGVYYTTGRKKARAARISPQYAGLFQSWEVTMWCSDSSWCDGCRDGCSCKECEIIAPRYYLDIR